MQATENILKKIIDRKQEIVQERKRLNNFDLLKKKVYEGSFSDSRQFKNALVTKVAHDNIAIIAELKKASPSKGLLREFYDPAQLAADYEKQGATCLSILTDSDFFLGKDEDLIIARHHCNLPVLRKDFIIDPYQIYESKLLGADCILLIAAVLDQRQLNDFYDIATRLELDAIIEVANDSELESALGTPAELIGINNRNLINFKVDINNTLSLRKKIPADRIVICESGIKNYSDIETMLAHDIHAFLIGEALVKSNNPGAKLRELMGK